MYVQVGTALEATTLVAGLVTAPNCNTAIGAQILALLRYAPVSSTANGLANIIGVLQRKAPVTAARKILCASLSDCSQFLAAAISAPARALTQHLPRRSVLQMIWHE